MNDQVDPNQLIHPRLYRQHGLPLWPIFLNGAQIIRFVLLPPMLTNHVHVPKLPPLVKTVVYTPVLAPLQCIFGTGFRLSSAEWVIDQIDPNKLIHHWLHLVAHHFHWVGFRHCLEDHFHPT